MAPRRLTAPEPVEIVLVALDGVTDPDPDAARPPPAGVGTMPPITHLVGTVITRVTDVPDPPLLPGAQDRPTWSDQRIHRLVRLPPWDAAAALRAFLTPEDGRAGTVVAARTGRPVRGRIGRRARLELGPIGVSDGAITVDGQLHVRGWGPATSVVLTLHPWSAQRTDLCLQPRRGRFGAHLPRRYYDVAHVVMDVVWHQIERAART